MTEAGFQRAMKIKEEIKKLRKDLADWKVIETYKEEAKVKVVVSRGNAKSYCYGDKSRMYKLISFEIKEIEGLIKKLEDEFKKLY